MPSIYNLSKILFNPELWIFIGFLIAFLLSWMTRCSGSVRLFLSLSILLYYGFATRPLAQALIQPLETYHHLPTTIAPGFDAIVLFVNDYPRVPPFGARPTVIGTRTADLLICGLTYVRSTRVRKIVLAEGVQQVLSSQDTGSGVVQEWALTLGYPNDAIVINDMGSATHERARAIKGLLESANRILLVDSAMHLPRSVAAFQKVGFVVTGIPCDYSSFTAHPWNIYDFIPSSGTLASSSEAVYEYVGLLAYWLRGFI